MSDAYATESGDQKSYKHRAEREAPPAEQKLEDPCFSLARPSSLLDERLRGSRGNTPVRSAAMLSAQQTHGNRAVQRVVHAAGRSTHPATEPVHLQRLLSGEMDWLTGHSDSVSSTRASWLDLNDWQWGFGRGLDSTSGPSDRAGKSSVGEINVSGSKDAGGFTIPSLPSNIPLPYPNPGGGHRHGHGKRQWEPPSFGVHLDNGGNANELGQLLGKEGNGQPSAHVSSILQDLWASADELLKHR